MGYIIQHRYYKDDDDHNKVGHCYETRFSRFDGNFSISDHEDLEYSAPADLLLSKAQVFGCCNGLLCLIDKKWKSPYLWNPSIRQFKKLPRGFRTNYGPDKPDWYPCSYGVGFDSIKNDHKVVQLFNIKRLDHHLYPAAPEHRIYSLSTNKWRWLPLNGCSVNPHKLAFLKLTAVCFNGGLYIIAREGCYYENRVIISFSFSKETFGRLSLPAPDLIESYRNWRFSYFSVGSLKESLALAVGYDRFESTDIWVFKEEGLGGLGTWNRQFRITRSDACHIHSMSQFGLKGEVIMRRWAAQEDHCYELGLWDFVKQEFAALGIFNDFDHDYVFPYSESLVQLKG